MGIRTIVFIVLFVFSTGAFAVPDIQHWTLDNGARVYFVEAHELPMVQLRVVFDAGSSHDPEGKKGLGVMTAALIGEGTADLDATAVAAGFERLGAEFGSGADRDMASVTLRSLSDPKLLNPAVALLARLLHAPSFPEGGLNRERQRTLVGLQQQTQLPGEVGSKAFYRALYPDHPYGAYPSGNEAGLRAITRKDLVNHHKRYYVGANAVLALIGDLSRREARKLSEQLLLQLVPGERPAPIPPVPMPKKSQERQIPFPSTQSHILSGMPGMKRQDPDYFSLYVGNYILGGGGLVSRLSTVIREEQGLSYSVYSYFNPMQEYGPFTMGLQTKNETRDQALALLRKTLKDFIDKGPSEEELVAAKKHLTGGFPLRIDSNGKIAGYLAVIGFYDLPLTYLNDFISRVEAVSADQIRDAFQRRVLPDKLVTVIVGGGQ